MGRIDGDGREDGQAVRRELVAQPLDLRLAKLRRLHEGDAVRGQLGAQSEPAVLLVRDQAPRQAVDCHELLRRRHAVVARLRHPGGDLAVEAGYAHHVELVEVCRRDRQEPQPLKQGMLLVQGFLQHASVELNPGKLAIEEPVLPCGDIDGNGRLGGLEAG